MVLSVCRWQRTHLSSALRRWQRHCWVGMSEFEARAAELERQRQLVVEQRQRGILMRMQRLTVASAWRGWRAFVEKRHRLRGLMLRMQNRHATMAMEGWAEFVYERQRQRSLVESFISRWSNSLVRAGLFTWKLWTRDARTAEIARRTELQRIRSVVGRIQRRCVSRAFDSWYALLCQRRRLRWFGATMVHRQKAMAVRSWVDFVDARVRQRSIMTRMLMRWSSDKLRKGWNNWKAFVLWMSAQQERERTRESRLRGVVRRIQNRSVSRALATWVALVSERKRIRRFLRHMQNRHLASAYQAWISHMETRQFMNPIIQQGLLK